MEENNKNENRQTAALSGHPEEIKKSNVTQSAPVEDNSSPDNDQQNTSPKGSGETDRGNAANASGH